MIKTKSAPRCDGWPRWRGTLTFGHCRRPENIGSLSLKTIKKLLNWSWIQCGSEASSWGLSESHSLTIDTLLRKDFFHYFVIGHVAQGKRNADVRYIQCMQTGTQLRSRLGGVSNLLVVPHFHVNKQALLIFRRFYYSSYNLYTEIDW